jgi:plastocyanin
MQRTRRVALFLAAALVSVSCGGAAADNGYSSGPTTTPTPPSTPGTPTGTNTSTIVVGTQSFDPTVVNIPVGATVNWMWDACAGDGYGGYGTCVTHNVTFDDGSGIQSGSQSSGSFSRTFNAAGTYKYHCAIHGAGMSGEIRVK